MKVDNLFEMTRKDFLAIPQHKDQVTGGSYTCIQLVIIPTRLRHAESKWPCMQIVTIKEDGEALRWKFRDQGSDLIQLMNGSTWQIDLLPSGCFLVYPRPIGPRLKLVCTMSSFEVRALEEGESAEDQPLSEEEMRRIVEQLVNSIEP